MVDNSFQLNSIFGSLADPTRRDILRRITGAELSVGEIAEPYGMTLAGISKHLKVLEAAKLVAKRRAGKQQYVTAAPAALLEASEYLDFYRKHVDGRFERLGFYLKNNP